MKQHYKRIAIISLIVSIISPMIAFSICCDVGEVEIFNIAGAIRYIWIFFLFIPIVAISFFLGLKLKELGLKYKQNYVVAFIVIPILVIFGSYRWLFSDAISFDKSNIENVESRIVFDLPNELKTATMYSDEYVVSYAKILNNQEKEDFKSEIIKNDMWTDNLGTLIENQMPFEIKGDLVSCEYSLCVFFSDDETLVNEYPEKGGLYSCVLVAYDIDLDKLVILNDYSVFINQGNTGE